MKTSEEIKVELEKIAAKNGGRLTPDDVLNEAKKAGSPLHDAFEWDNTKAGHMYRITQARTLIRSVRIDVVTTTKVLNVVAYMRDPDAENDEQGYVSVPKLIGDSDRAHAALATEYARLRAIFQRVRDLAEALGGDVSEVDEIANATQRFIAKFGGDSASVN